MILLDTNVLIRYSKRTDPAHPTVRTVVERFLMAGELLCLVPQNLYEFWVVATRPVENNGLGMTIERCDAEIANFLVTFDLLPDSPDLITEWSALVRAHGCHGKVAHDARLVAAMRTHGINSI